MNKSTESHNSSDQNDLFASHDSGFDQPPRPSPLADGGGLPLALALARADRMLARLLQGNRRCGRRPRPGQWLAGLTLDDLFALVQVLCAARTGQQDSLGLALRLTSALAPAEPSEDGPGAHGPLLELLVRSLAAIPSAPDGLLPAI